MIINLYPNGKILREKPNLHLPNFTVLTGKNGSGKSQLLHHLKYGMDLVQPYDASGQAYTFQDPLNPSITTDEKSEINDIVLQLPGLNITSDRNQNEITRGQIEHEWNGLRGIASAFALVENKSFADDNEIVKELNSKLSDIVAMYQNPGSPPIRSQAIVTPDKIQALRTLGSITGRPISELRFIDLLIFHEIKGEAFSPIVDLIFHQFYFKSKYYSELVNNVEPPWDVFNDIMKNLNLPYSVRYENPVSEEIISHVRLTNIHDVNVVIDFDNLSSGEKTIMSLGFLLYHSTNSGKFPQLILLDEPDAHLHPSLAEKFMSVIQDVIVKQNGVSVIMTTHSPSTIAFTPEESLYVMDRDLGYPIKENRQNAIKELSNGFVTLTEEEGDISIDYFLENSELPVLFVEGATDLPLIKLAWTKLYGTQKMPFAIKDCFGGDFIRNHFNHSQIYKKYPTKQIICLFDHDNKGFCCWRDTNGGNKKNDIFTETETDPEKCLAKRFNDRVLLLLLPCTQNNEIRSLAVVNNQILGPESKLTIESLLLGAPGFKDQFFDKVNTVGGGSCFQIKDIAKTKIATAANSLDKEYFEEFRPIFDSITNFIKSKNPES